MKKINELYFYYKKKGFRDTAKRIYGKYFSISSFTVYKGILGKENINESNSLIEDGYEIIINDIEYLKKIRYERNDLPREFYIDVTHGGQKFYLVSLEKEPAYIVWIFGKDEYSRFCNISDHKTVEFAYGYTMPLFRGKRLYSKTMNYACNDLKNKGYEIVLGVISEGNVNCHNAIKYTVLREYKKINSYFSFNKKLKV